MAAPMTAGMPPELDLDAGYVIRVTALDAASGALVSGVKVSGLTLEVTNVHGGDLNSAVQPLLVNEV